MAMRGSGKGKGKSGKGSGEERSKLKCFKEWTNWTLKKAKVVAGFIPLIIVIAHYGFNQTKPKTALLLPWLPRSALREAFADGAQHR